MPIEAATIIEQFSSGVALLREPDHVFVAASPAYRAMIGDRDPVGRPFREVIPELRDQGVFGMLDQVVATKEPLGGEGFAARWDTDGDGEEESRFVDFHCQPILDGSGEIWGILLQVDDVTDRVRTEREQAFLLEATAALDSSLNYQITLTAVTSLAANAIADWCAIDELAPDGTLRRIAVAHPDPEKVELAYQLHERYPPDPAATRGVPNILRTGKTEWLAHIPDELLVASTVDEDHLRIVRELGLKSYISVPLIARGHVLGALSLVSAESGRRYGPSDVRFAEELARRAAIAIDNARLFRDSEEARLRLEETAVELEAQAEELQFTQSELEMANEELRTVNEELLEKASEANEAFEAERAARAEAELANRAKTDFLSAMSHELRTPLNAIAGYVDLLDLGVHGPLNEAQARAITRIKRSQEILLGLISDVLNFARVEAGRMEYRSELVPLAPLLEGLEEVVAQQVSAKTLTYEAAGIDGVVVRGDSDRIQQIMINLLSNAAKFTEPGGSIRVTAEVRGPIATVAVRDTGRGIPPERLTEIFDPFVQIDRHRTDSSQQGVGLGLAISRELARGMGGDLTVESTPGEGSTFILTLPSAAE